MYSEVKPEIRKCKTVYFYIIYEKKKNMKGNFKRFEAK